MKDFISWKNVKSVAYRENYSIVWLLVQYNDKSQDFEHVYHYDETKTSDVFKRECLKHQDMYVKIKNVLINKQDFIEIELWFR
jgi:hypothetical protein